MLDSKNQMIFNKIRSIINLKRYRARIIKINTMLLHKKLSLQMNIHLFRKKSFNQNQVSKELNVHPVDASLLKLLTRNILKSARKYSYKKGKNLMRKKCVNLKVSKKFKVKK